MGKLSHGMKGEKNFFENINNPTYVQRHMKVDKRELKEILETILGKEVSRNKIDKIFDLVSFKRICSKESGLQPRVT